MEGDDGHFCSGPVLFLCHPNVHCDLEYSEPVLIGSFFLATLLPRSGRMSSSLQKFFFFCPEIPAFKIPRLFKNAQIRSFRLLPRSPLPSRLCAQACERENVYRPNVQDSVSIGTLCQHTLQCGASDLPRLEPSRAVWEHVWSWCRRGGCGWRKRAPSEQCHALPHASNHANGPAWCQAMVKSFRRLLINPVCQGMFFFKG